MLDLALAKEFAILDAKQRQLKEERSEILKTLEEIERKLLDNFAAEGVSRVELSDGTTVRVSSLVWAKISDKIEAAKILKATGFGEYVVETFNTNQISTILREHIEDGRELPPEFAGVIEPNEVFKVKAF